MKASYEDLLHRVNTITLHLERMQSIAVETYKCLKGIAPEYIRDLVEYKNAKYNFRYETCCPCIQLELAGTKRTVSDSSLPNEIRCAEIFKDFKRLVRT